MSLLKISIIALFWWLTPGVTDTGLIHNLPLHVKIFYGKDIFQFGDLQLPTNNASSLHPVAIIIHGGCWTSSLATTHYINPFAEALRDLGIATWNIEYRGINHPKGGWPGTFQDIGNAIDYLRILAKQYKLDLNRVIVVGHSAGGHLALWAAARHNLSSDSLLYKKNPLPLKGVLSLGGIPDLKTFYPQSLITCGQDAITKLLGAVNGLIEQHYKDASPRELLPFGIPQILIYGAKDTLVPLSSSLPYVKLAEKKDEKIKLIEIKNAAHHEYIIPNSISWETVKSAILSLF